MSLSLNGFMSYKRLVLMSVFGINYWWHKRHKWPDLWQTFNCLNQPAVTIRTAQLNGQSSLDPFEYTVKVIKFKDTYDGRTQPGTGFIVDNTGLLVTNCHVTCNRDEMLIRWSNSFQSPSALVVYREPHLDMALVRIPSPTTALNPCQLSGDVVTGQHVMCMGCPKINYSFGMGFVMSSRAVMPHLIPNQSSIDVNHRIISHSVTTSPGFSGGPLIDSNGHVVGVNSCGGVTYKNGALHGQDVIDFVKRGIEYERQDRLMSFLIYYGLGCRLRQTDNGFLVTNLWGYGDSAFINRLETNDVITQIGGKPFVCLSQLTDAIHVLPQTDKLDVQVIRRGRMGPISVAPKLINCLAF